MLHIQQVMYIYMYTVYIYILNIYRYICILYVCIYILYIYTYYICTYICIYIYYIEIGMYIFIYMFHDHICKRQPIYLQMHTCTCISCHAGKKSKLYSRFLVDPWCVFKWFFLMYVHKLLFDSNIGTHLTISLMDHMGTSGDDTLGVVWSTLFTSPWTAFCEWRFIHQHGSNVFELHTCWSDN